MHRARYRRTNVVALVYVAAFGLDEGESIGGLLAQAANQPHALAHLRIDDEGAAWLPQDDFVKHFAADVDTDRSERDVRRPTATGRRPRSAT